MEQKNKSMQINNAANQVRMIYNSDRTRAVKLIEDYLEHQLMDNTSVEKVEFMDKLANQFISSPPKTIDSFNLENEQFSRLFKLLLGNRFFQAELSSSEITERLAHSLNKVFDTLNQIIRVIHTTLFGKISEIETIRGIIGSHLKEKGEYDSLQSYLDQIQESFLITHKAFQKAAHIKVKQILNELDPDHITSLVDKGLKFGPLHKAELFDRYKEIFQTCKDWFESERFMKELLGEFEKTCQKFYEKQDKNKPLWAQR